MNKTMTLDEACIIIENFVVANNLDPLSGIELMTKYFKQIAIHERQALIVFMEETKSK